MLDRLGRKRPLLDPVEAAIEVELLVLGPQPPDDREPFGGALVARLVVEQIDPEHLDLRQIPAGHDVEHEASVGDVVDGGALLGGHDRMDGRHVRGGEDGGIGRRSADASRPGEAFEAGAIEVGDPAEAPPAPDRHQCLEPHLLGELGERERGGPADPQRAFDGGDRRPVVEVGTEVPSLSLRSLNSGFVPRRNSAVVLLALMRYPLSGLRSAPEPALLIRPAGAKPTAEFPGSLHARR
jgi:hypothetical protein